MNAAIESAHAGDAGRGFAVVADEIRRLSITTRENSHNISQTLSGIIKGITVTANSSNDTGDVINGMSKEINGFAGTMTELINTLTELSSGSSEITSTLATLHDVTEAIKTSYSEVMAITAKLRSAVEDLESISEKAG
jgi:methyl-accepting chemotaxis protein